MPGFLTHLLFGRQSLHALKERSFPFELKDVLATYPHAFNIGTQGPDVFFYYLRCNLNPKQKLGSIMHHAKTDEYFRCCLDFLAKPNPNEIKELFASYFAGLICHYTLDCKTHPFIYSRTEYDPERSEGLGYLAAHCQYESNLDCLLLKQLTHRVPSDYNGARLITLTKKESALLGKALSDTITRTYFPNSHSAYTTTSFMKNALHSMSWKVAFLTDHGGPKRKVIEFIESSTVKAHVLTCLFSVDDITENKDYFNLSRASWKNPWDTSVELNDSFPMLYEDALNLCCRRLKMFADYYASLPANSKHHAERELLKNTLIEELKDYSYNTGLSWRIS